MRLLPCLLLILCAPLAAQTADEKDAIAAVQKVFDGMKEHDAAKIGSVMLPDARLYNVRETGVSTNAAAADFGPRVAAMQGDLAERFTSAPQVLIRGRIAQVWGEYEFVRDGKFDHCGVDSVSLLKSADGWKIAAIAYTSETTGCKGH